MTDLPQDIIDEVAFRKKCEEERETEAELARQQHGSRYREMRWVGKWGLTREEYEGL